LQRPIVRLARPARRPRRTRLTGLVGRVGLVGLVVGCSGDDGSAAATTIEITAPPTLATTTVATTVPPTAPPTAPPMTPEELAAAVGASFASVFAPGTQDPAFVQNGDEHAPTLDALRAAPSADTTVTVNAVLPLADADCEGAGITPPCAAVAWTLAYKGSVLMADTLGHVVYADGAWQVAERTWCTITEQFVAAPAGC
jgi:hypothetical protein